MLRETAAPTRPKKMVRPTSRLASSLGENLDLRLLARRPLDRLDDVSESGVPSDAVDPDHDLTVLHGGAGVHLVAGLSLDRQTFASHGVLVDQRLPADHVTVDRNSLTRPEHDRVAGREGRRRDALLAPALSPPHRLVWRSEEVAQRSSTTHDCPLQDPLPDGEEAGEQAGRRVVSAHEQDKERHGIQGVYVQAGACAQGLAEPREDRQTGQHNKTSGDAGRDREERRRERGAGRRQIQQRAVANPRLDRRRTEIRPRRQASAGGRDSSRGWRLRPAPPAATAPPCTLGDRTRRPGSRCVT